MFPGVHSRHIVPHSGKGSCTRSNASSPTSGHAAQSGSRTARVQTPKQFSEHVCALVSLVEARRPGARMSSLRPQRWFVSFLSLCSPVRPATWWTELSFDPELVLVAILGGGPCALAPGFPLFSRNRGLFESRSLQVWLNKQILESDDKFGGFSDPFCST